MLTSDRSLLRLLDSLDAAGLSGLMPTLLDHLADAVGAVGVRLLIADVEARRFDVRDVLQAGDGPRSQEIEIQGSVHGRAYTDGGVVRAEIDGRSVLITPVTARRERQGVLEVTLGRAPADEDADVVETLGVIFGYLVTAGDLWTDEFHFARRRRDMTLAAEIQWGLLPLAAFSTREISIAGALEPAYEVGGDTFDYACGERTLTLAIFDSMGHGLGAARLSSLCVGTFRNARRAGRSILEQADRIHETLLPGFEREGYTTGAILNIDLASPERSQVVNAGQEQPFLQRGDARPVQIGLRPEIPFGMPFSVERRVEELELQPGDRLTLFSDGMIEAKPDGGEVFGLEALGRILSETRELPPREATRIATRAVRDHRAAHLEDDATIVIVDIAG
ncbi:MAG: serine/threonine-protein phosphatase [Actinomycetota bacterium]|nr:serine/threonine-protein phosphatase [Actinomycetota bacterium]